MKTILLLLLTCLPLCAATTYPMLSDTTNRTVTGGVTNMSLLNANQTFTGTNTFPAASFYPANGIASRTLFSCPTNLYASSLVVSAIDSTITNAGGIANVTSLLTVVLPPLLGSNSSVYVYWVTDNTNANSTAGNIAFYVGTNTNYLAGANTMLPTSANRTYQNGTSLMFNVQSFTNQLQGAFSSVAQVNFPTNFTDTSVSWTLYLGGFTTTSHTNAIIRNLKLVEVF